MSVIRKRRGLESTLSHLIFFGMVILFISPVLYVVVESFKPPGMVMTLPPSWKFTPTLTNYRSVFANELRGHFFPRFILNSLITAGAATLVALIAGTMAAYALARFEFGARNNLMSFILSTRMFPPAATMVPVFSMMIALKLVDTYPGLILPYAAFNLPFVVWLMRGFLAEIPVELEEAALIDGATRFQSLRLVLVPLAAPGLVSTAIFSFVLSWNEFLFALVLTRTEVRTAPVEIAQFVTMYGVQWGEMFAAATLMTLPVMLMGLVVWRSMVRGLTFGAVKG